jgi:ribosomal protein S12 methylthiotransferase
MGRTAADAPEIDGVVTVRTRRKFAAGDFVEVRITAAGAHDLVGVPT